MATKSGKQDRLWLGGQGERRFVGWLLLVGWLMGQAKLEAEAAAAAATRLSSSLCLRLPARITVLDGGGRASQRKPTQRGWEPESAWAFSLPVPIDPTLAYALPIFSLFQFFLALTGQPFFFVCLSSLPTKVGDCIWTDSVQQQQTDSFSYLYRWTFSDPESFLRFMADLWHSNSSNKLV